MRSLSLGLTLSAVLLLHGQADAQNAQREPSAPAERQGNWKNADGRGRPREPRVARASTEGGDAASDADAGRRPTTSAGGARFIEGEPQLPHADGQIYREYDISPYTIRVTSTNRPEQAIIDWILRDIGYEAWFNEPAGFMSASPRALKVYHTPAVQARVAELVDRFVNTEAETHSFSVRIASVDNPNWRARSALHLKPIAVESQGVQAWLVQKEDAALLVAELRKRNDYQEHSTPHLLVNNGQSTVVSAVRGRRYVRGILPHPEVWPGFENDYGQIDEGFTFELSPLLSLDGRMIDAVVKCNIDQVEQMVPVTVDVPSQASQRQQAKIEVPQLAQCRVHERFRWPSDQVLIVGLGVVATPLSNDTPNALQRVLPFKSAPDRADLLMFVESKGRLGQTGGTAAAAAPAQAAAGPNSRGRY